MTDRYENISNLCFRLLICISKLVVTKRCYLELKQKKSTGEIGRIESKRILECRTSFLQQSSCFKFAPIRHIYAQIPISPGSSNLFCFQSQFGGTDWCLDFELLQSEMMTLSAVKSEIDHCTQSFFFSFSFLFLFFRNFSSIQQWRKMLQRFSCLSLCVCLSLTLSLFDRFRIIESLCWAREGKRRRVVIPFLGLWATIWSELMAAITEVVMCRSVTHFQGCSSCKYDVAMQIAKNFPDQSARDGRERWGIEYPQ